MGRFLPTEALIHGKVQSSASGLKDVVSKFPPNLKQAMYAAATKYDLKRGTWNGCAFNEAGYEVGGEATSTASAAEVFGISTGLVTEFINTWDADTRTDRERTAYLKDLLLEVGLTTPVEVEGKKVTVFSSTVFKGTQSKFIEELESVNSLADLEGFDCSHIEAVAELIGC
jgi:hypothetical protein